MPSLPRARATTAIRSLPAAIGMAVVGAYALVVAWQGLSPTATLAWLPLVFLVAFFIVRASIGMPATIQGNVLPRRYANRRYQLVAMPINHFGERLRWCLDLLGVGYEETDVAGILSIFLRGRTVPWLVDRQSNSILGNSDEALWFVGALRLPELRGPKRREAEALLHRDEHTRAWEDRLHALGHAVQGWAYYHFLGPQGNRRHSLVLWGRYEPHVPYAQRLLLWLGYPVLKAMMRKAFNLGDAAGHAKRRHILDGVIADVEAALAQSSGPFVFGEHLSYVDVTLCSLLGPLMPRSIMPLWAKGRFQSMLTLLDDPTWPDELTDFEQHLAARPCGAYLLRVYTDYRTACFATAEDAPAPRRPYRDMMPRED